MAATADFDTHSRPAKAMVERDIISIDEKLCNGCGVCLPSCAEGALTLENGKVKIIADKLCDGLGACLGACPRGALRVTRRTAVPFDESAVQEHVGPKSCPSLTDSPVDSAANSTADSPANSPTNSPVDSPDTQAASPAPVASGLASANRHWPIKLQLTPVDKPFLKDAHLLLTADCAPAACPGFAARYQPGKVMLITCPKLEEKQAIVDKLVALFRTNPPLDITLARMEVPCCCLPDLVRRAQEAAGTSIPVSTVVLTRYGQENLPGFGPKGRA